RRLVQAGVRCVTIDHSNWDTHDANFATLKRQLLPWLDGALSTLFRDLAERGLLESTLVVVTGEFGRTPRINKNAGRDHWGPAFTVLLGGGGVRGGVVVGRSDARAERPATDPYGPEDLFATVFHQLGIDPRTEFHTPDGRELRVPGRRAARRRRPGPRRRAVPARDVRLRPRRPRRHRPGDAQAHSPRLVRGAAAVTSRVAAGRGLPGRHGRHDPGREG